jgi:uncharacterized membrane protein
VKWALLGSVVLLATGAVLVAVSVVQGGASVALFGFIPVVSGSSGLFLLGVALLFVGFLSVPFAWAAGESGPAPTLREEVPEPPPSKSSVPASRSGGFGGLVLIGPVPILFGSWKGVSSQVRWALAIVGAVIFTVAVVAVLWLLR